MTRSLQHTQAHASAPLTSPAWLGDEGQLLLRSVRTAITGVPDPLLAGLVRSATAEWAQMATDHKLGVLALQGLGADVERLPASVRAALELTRAQAIRSNTAGLLTLRRAMPLLGQANVRALAFKGPIGQLGTYGGLFAKPSTDVDLLVSPSDFDRARAALAQGGYQLPRVCETPWWRRFLGEQPLLHADPSLAPIDLHHKLQQPGCPAPRRPDRFLAQAELLPVAGTLVKTLSMKHAILVASISLAKGMVNREPTGGHVADITARLRKCDANSLSELRSEARDQGLSNTLALGLQAARALFGSELGLSCAVASPLGLLDAELAQLVLTPTAPTAPWPRRRDLLRGLSDNYASFVSELALTAASEVCRRIYEPRRSVVRREASR